MAAVPSHRCALSHATYAHPPVLRMPPTSVRHMAVQFSRIQLEAHAKRPAKSSTNCCKGRSLQHICMAVMVSIARAPACSTYAWLLWWVQGFGAVRELENVATESGDKPTHECFIKDCGELPPGADLSPPKQVNPWNSRDWGLRLELP